MQYEIVIAYDEDRLTAALDCPLCGAHWESPFPLGGRLKTGQ